MTKDKIEEAAYQEMCKNTNISLNGRRGFEIGFTTGALSPEAKEYWQKGMYSEEEVISLLWSYRTSFIKEGEYEFAYLLFKHNKKK